MTTYDTRPTRPELSASLSVNALIEWYPSVLPVLNAFGIDTCCGGADSLEVAARAAHVRLDDLMAGLSAAVEHIVSRSSLDANLSPAAGADR